MGGAAVVIRPEISGEIYRGPDNRVRSLFLFECGGAHSDGSRSDW